MSFATTADAPAHNSYLHPSVIKFTGQWASRISLKKEKETNIENGIDPHWVWLITQETGSYTLSLGIPKVEPEPSAVAYAYSFSPSEGEAEGFQGVQACWKTYQDTDLERERGGGSTLATPKLLSVHKCWD